MAREHFGAVLAQVRMQASLAEPEYAHPHRARAPQQQQQHARPPLPPPRPTAR